MRFQEWLFLIIVMITISAVCIVSHDRVAETIPSAVKNPHLTPLEAIDNGLEKRTFKF